MDCGKTETICQLDVCDDILVTAQHFKGGILVHTRNYREGANGEKAPKKKGATIPIDRLKIFTDTFKQTDDAIKRFKGDREFNFRIYFGANWCVNLSKYPLINIRKWFRPENR